MAPRPLLTYVALLRGINVGTAKRVPMVKLRALLEGLGFERVETLLNSGNAVFDAPKRPPAQHAAAIADALAATFRFAVPVVVKSAQDMDAIVDGNTLAARHADPSRLLAVFTQSPAALKGLARIASLVVPPEQFLLDRQAGYLYCANGSAKSKAGLALLSMKSAVVTTRNWATVCKIQALMTARRTHD